VVGDEAREVTVPCPWCRQPFALAVACAPTGAAVDVVDRACDCDLTEDEYEDLCDRAVALAEANGDRGTPEAAAAESGPGGGLWGRVRRWWTGES
jgi:hypothetical protein